MAFASPSLFSWQVGPCPQVYKKKKTLRPKTNLLRYQFGPNFYPNESLFRKAHKTPKRYFLHVFTPQSHSHCHSSIHSISHIQSFLSHRFLSSLRIRVFDYSNLEHTQKIHLRLSSVSSITTNLRQGFAFYIFRFGNFTLQFISQLQSTNFYFFVQLRF